MTGSGDELVERVHNAIAEHVGYEIRQICGYAPYADITGLHEAARAAIDASGLTALREDEARLREQTSEQLNSIVAEMRYAVAGGMSWISHDEAANFTARLERIASALTNRSSHEPE